MPSVLSVEMAETGMEEGRGLGCGCLAGAILAIASMLGSTTASAEDLDELASSFGGEDVVSIATGRQQPIRKAPAVATVITAADIKSIGARDLNEVLEAVPGLHVSVQTTYNPIFIVRGLYADANQRVLMLVNGVPLKSFFDGGLSQVWGGMPVEAISRVEVIRGPGSAVYGADAFAGVINIITKTRDDVAGTEAGLRAGSYQSKQAWAIHGGEWRDWEGVVALEAQTTDGHGRSIDRDAQSTFDRLLGTSASYAPGGVNVGVKALDARVDLSDDRWRLRAGYQGRRDWGTGAGVAEALDPNGSGKSDRVNLDLNYAFTGLNPDWDVSSQLSYLYIGNETDLVLFPPGADFSLAGGGPFPAGVIGRPDVFERHTRFNISAFYTGFADHSVRLGAGYHYGDMYKIREEKNLRLHPVTLVPVPLPGGVTDVSATDPFIKETSRRITYLFAQDEWSLAPDWVFTGGVRYDDYSDFGATVNPRLALVWNADHDLTAKLLYGRAFRAPSFAEEFNVNNPVRLGNPNLDPEKIDTVELALDYQPTSNLRANINLFYYEMRDIIRFIPDPPPASSSTAQNAGEQDGHGLEGEIKWEINRQTQLVGNYAYQRSKDRVSGSAAGNVPAHQLYVRGDWAFAPNWELNAQLNRVQGRKRPSGDARPPVPDYTTLDLTVRHVYHQLEFAASVRNVLDDDVREPSPQSGLIPNDLPQAGRNFFLELRYHW